MHGILLLLTIVLCCTSSNAQILRLVRTDMQGSTSVLTASRTFGFDIIVDSMRSVTAVSFELRHSYAQYVRLAAWKPRQLSQTNVYVIDLSDSARGIGSIHVGVLSSTSTTIPGPQSQSVIHLDFVVSPDAPHRSIVSFELVNAEAVVRDSMSRVVQLKSVPYVGIIHGYITVYPGDANNDGRVDQRDFSTVALYVGQGTKLRGYRRELASTLWQPQRALTWSDAQATYADCDGSGDITLADALVVKLNFGRGQSTPLQQGIEPHYALRPLIPFSGTAFRFTVPFPRVSAIAFSIINPAKQKISHIASLDHGWIIDFVWSDTVNGKTYCVISTDAPLDDPDIALQVCGVDDARIDESYVLLGNNYAIVPAHASLSTIDNTNHNTSGTRCMNISYSHGQLSIIPDDPSCIQLISLDGRTYRIILSGSPSVSVDIGTLPAGTYILVNGHCHQLLNIINDQYAVGIK